MEAISALFLGVPYKLGPLGEGPDGEFDRDPLIRFDAFDCTTFVETVMALALESDLDAAARTLQKIRYKDGQIGYATRNHFIGLDWVPNNVRAGSLRDITADVAGPQRRQGPQDHLQEELVPAQISGQSRRRLHQGREAAPRLQAAASGQPVAGSARDAERAAAEGAASALANIPSGTIANLVHADRRDKGTMVSHQVFLIKKSDGWYVRHAASGKAVEDDPIAILGRYRDLRWRLIGLNLDVLRDPTPEKAPH